jgi:hypothetical protein
VRSHARISLLALLVGAITAVSAPAVAQAAFGIETFVAVNCKTTAEKCASSEVEIPGIGFYNFPKEPTLAQTQSEGYSQAAGHVPFGITDFKVNTTGTFPNEAPSGGPITHIRTDVAAGLATSPAAVPECSIAEFDGTGGELAGTGFYPESKCKTETEVGVNKATVYLGPEGVAPGVSDLPLEGPAYNLVQREGLASEFGVAVKLPKTLTEHILSGTPYKGTGAEKLQYYAHTLIEGSVEWGKEAKGTNAGDYHDYFEITVSPLLPTVTSRLVFFGRAGEGDFITNGTACPGNNTTRLALTNEAGTTVTKSYTTLVSLNECGLVPFQPSFSLSPATTEQEAPDGISTNVALPRHPGATEIDSSQLKTAVFTLPEGMTLNPSAAAGLSACTPAQARINSSTPGVACPASSELGTVSIEVPTLPAGSLKGKIYLGGPESGAITEPPYTMYLDAESSRYGVSVRVKGSVTPNPTTGQVTTTFSENPEQPFTSVSLKFKTGALAPIANPLTCGTATSAATFSPLTATANQSPAVTPFTVDGNGEGGACLSPIPFALSQSTEYEPATAGSHTNYSYFLGREDGNQYLSQVKTVLPAGLVGQIPLVTQCGETQANAGTCSSASRIGTATVQAGAGPTPYTFSGPVFLTGPYHGAPFGLSISVPAVAGPFNLGNVVTRSTINVDQSTARVTVTSAVPTIVKGVPIRLRSINVDTNKQGFLLNPTSCGVLATESTLTSTLGATQTLSSPFQASNCTGLAFKPTFTATANGKTSKANGAGLETTINQPAGQANIKQVLVQLPKQLPSRLTTLNKACPEKTFAANPYSCDAGSFVGNARANTPTLPGKLQGPAILVSHGGEAFPDLDLVMEANGVRVIVVGNTKITKGITTTNFQTTPDVPVTSITVNLPTGPHSALAANGDLCTSSLVMPTTITGQNGKSIKQNTKMAVANCPVTVVGHKVVGNTAYLTIRTYSAGRVSASGPNLSTVARHLGSAQKTASLKVPLSSGGRSKGRPLKVRVRVGFFPKKKGAPTSVAFTTVTFR